MKTTPQRAEQASPSPSPGRRRLALKATVALAWGSFAAALPGCGGGGEPTRVTGQATDGRKGGLGGVDSGGTGAQRSFFGMALRAVQPLSAGGVLFNTVDCRFVDALGKAFDPATLAPGMTVRIDAGDVVEVDGVVRSDAQVLRRDEQLVGEVQSVSGPTATLVVWSQSVQVNTDTLFDTRLAASWSQLTPGTRIRVWGQLDPVLSRVVATRIDSPDASDQDTVRGVLTAFDPATGSVAVGGLAAQAPAGQGLPDDLVAGGVVRLTLGPATGSGAAASLRQITNDVLQLPDRETVELEGRVTDVASATDFTLDGVPVQAGAATWNQPGPLQPGQRVAVSGQTLQGVLIATSVEVQREEEDNVVEIDGRIRSVDHAAQRFVIGRRAIHWNASTHFEDSAADNLRPRARVEVKGRRNPDGSIEAFLIHIEL